jgi:hypothetical protein
MAASIRWTSASWTSWRHSTVAMPPGDLPPGDPLLTTRLILGMTIWVANWFRTREGFSPAEIQDRALELLALVAPPPAPPARGRKRG